jgi:hypothetical protein
MATAGATTPGALLDTRSVAKPVPFDGSESGLPAWRFVFESYAMLQSAEFYKHMNNTADLGEDPHVHEMADEAVNLSRVFFVVLVSLVPNRLLSSMMNAERAMACRLGGG